MLNNVHDGSKCAVTGMLSDKQNCPLAPWFCFNQNVTCLFPWHMLNDITHENAECDVVSKWENQLLVIGDHMLNFG